MNESPLDRRMYAVAEAGRLLSVEARKLRRWLNGATIRGRPYPPVIRRESTDSDVLTWAEFVEAGLLKEYRERRVSLQHMRPMIDAMRRDFQVEYPLAHFKPVVDKATRELVLRAQTEVDLDESLYLIRRHGLPDGTWQLQWTEPVRKFLDKVEFDEDGIARRMHPLGRAVPVVLDPDVLFGIPQVRGVRTETIAESFAELGDERRTADLMELSIEDVQAALRWEVTYKAA